MDISKNILKCIFTALLSLAAINISLAQIKIKAVGDVMLGSVTPKTVLPPDNGKEFAESIGKYLGGADIVFGNLEGAIIKDTIPPEKCSDRSRLAKTCYEFGMPDSIAPALKELRFSVMSLDNNHSEDYGENGYNHTQQKLTELGIEFISKKGFVEIDINKNKIAFVAFGYSENSFHISDSLNTVNVIKKLSEEYEIVFVSFHGGAEGKNAQHVPDSTEIFLGENRGNLISFAHTAIDAGADLIIGHGPHVLRAFEIYKNKFIAYSLGNFLTYGNMNINGVTGITAIAELNIDLDSGDFLRGRIIPVKQVGYGVPIYDETFEAVNIIKNLTKEDIADSKLFFSSEGYFYNTDEINIKMKGDYLLSKENYKITDAKEKLVKAKIN